MPKVPTMEQGDVLGVYIEASQLVSIMLYELLISFTGGGNLFQARCRRPLQYHVCFSLKNVRNTYDVGHSVYLQCPIFLFAVPQFLHVGVDIVLRENWSIPLVVQRYSLVVHTIKITKCLSLLCTATSLPSNPKKWPSNWSILPGSRIDSSR